MQRAKSVKLSGKEIDNQLNFDRHISNLCGKAVMQLNSICGLEKYMSNIEKIVMVNNFVFSSFQEKTLATP